MYDLLPLLWSRSGAANLRCTTCCHCFGLEIVPPKSKMYDRLVVSVSKWCPKAKIYKFGSVALSKWYFKSKMYDLLPLLWFRRAAMSTCTIQCSDVRFVAVAAVSK